ncbi:MAG: T9SS type A sorting domain-containing protein, partial [Psychroflexus halocasei]
LNIQGLDSLEVQRLSVYNVLGQQLLSSETTEALNVDQLSEGTYILEITTKENKTTTERFIKK